MADQRLRILLAIVGGAAIVLALVVWSRIARVNRGAASIPTQAGAREGGKRVRYWPRLVSWDDRSSARVDRVMALPRTASLIAIARQANDSLAAHDWYLVSPDELRPMMTDPQVIVWQRDPDERLDLMQLWPVPGMTPTQRMHGGAFPAEFLDAPQVIGWSWMLGGPRAARPNPSGSSIVHFPSSPPPPPPPPPPLTR